MSNPNLPIAGNYNTYIGARYVPLILGTWSETVAYEPLSIVTYQGNSYTSKTFVPAGTPVSNETYWSLTGNYNAQVEQYRQEVQNISSSLSGIDDDITELNTTTTSLSNQMTTANNNISTLQSDVSTLEENVESLQEINYTKINDLKNRTFILIGDSYGTGQNESGTPTTSWIQLFKNNVNATIYSNAINGIGFTTTPSFTNALSQVEVPDHSKVTDIIVLGGYNDTSNPTTGMESFMTYVKTNYPNAIVRLGHIGWSRDSNKNLSLVQYKTVYKTICEYGGFYLGELEYVLHDYSNFVSDGFHPNQKGQQDICNALLNTLLGNHSSTFNVFNFPQLTNKLVNSEPLINSNLLTTFSGNTGLINFNGSTFNVDKTITNRQPITFMSFDNNMGYVIAQPVSFKTVTWGRIVGATSAYTPFEVTISRSNKTTNLNLIPYGSNDTFPTGITQLLLNAFNFCLPASTC